MAFSARRWQLAHAGEFQTWSDRSGRLQDGLESLCAAIAETGEQFLFDRQTAEKIARWLPECYRSCNDLTFSELEQTQAYAMLHLADRYGCVQQVLTELLGIGALPLRRERMSVLEVGAGPAPALYATKRPPYPATVAAGRGCSHINRTTNHR